MNYSWVVKTAVGVREAVAKQALVGCIPVLQKYLAIGNRGYTNQVRLRGLNWGWVGRLYL